MRRAAKIAVWVLGIPAVLLVVCYFVLLITPIRLPFAGDAVRGFVQSAIPPSSTIEMGDMALALEGGVWPVIQFSPVVMTDRKSGARVAMRALEVGFSPARAVLGQPGATVTVVEPHVQLVQDLYGPRLSTFEMVDSPDGGLPTLRVLEGEDAFPAVAISPEGIGVAGKRVPMRSDNDWLIFNLEASEVAINDLASQFNQGLFSRLMVRGGTIDMSDTVYSLHRRFEKVSLQIGSNAKTGMIEGEFGAEIGGRQVYGTIARTVSDDGASRLQLDITNIDFSAFLPFMDDADSMAAMRGAGAVSLDMAFSPAGGKLVDGTIKVDLTGLDLRIGTDYFPVVSSILEVQWFPASGQFKLEEGALQIGQSSARISGTFAMGLDKTYGPTIGIALHAKDVSLHPNDMSAPEQPFETMDFSGWSAPLYGALGIDRFVARKGDAVVETTGRLDMLVAGLGIKMEVAGEGVTADDLKRLWPYIMGKESRDWFVANVTQGVVKNSRMQFRFPVGSLGLEGEDKPIPEGGMHVEIVGENVAIRATETMAPILIEGDTKLIVDDADVTIAGGGGTIETAGGTISVRNPAIVMDNSNPSERIIEISGDLTSPIPALVALLKEQQPDALAGTELPVDLNAITGAVDLGLVATIALEDPETGRPMDIDYVINGNVRDFGSSQPIEGRKIGNGQLAFSASQDGYQLGGTAEIDGMKAEVAVEGTPESEPTLRIGSTVDVADLAALGFDASQFLSGKVRFVAQPQAEGTMSMLVDLRDAGLTIKDLGISKAVGTAGQLTATIKPNGDTTLLEDIALGFGTVALEGDIEFHTTKGLVSADFSKFALSSGDKASVSVAPRDGGYQVRIRGQQLDLKPMLSQFFSLGQGSGGVQTTQFNQTIDLDVKLDRAVGYYATNAFNVDLALLLAGSDLRRAKLSAQFGEGNAVSITTNPAPNGRTMTVAFNDAGTILRLLGVYSQLAGGTGSLVLQTDRTQDVEAGQLVLRNFAIVDEKNVAQILGNQSNSRAAIAAGNRLDFDAAQVDFLRRKDRVEVTNGLLAGNTVGGTIRGFIYTDRRQYDLAGTYVPLYGLNNAFQQIPLLGPLLGGRDGEGLLGVTFAVQGPLDNPQFKINPLSALVPGAFRELFEFRARELPR